MDEGISVPGPVRAGGPVVDDRGMNGNGTLEEAYERLHLTGPEFEGWLTNHGPMAVEAMVRHGHARQVHRWLDVYARRLDDLPRGSSPITADDWRSALGDPR